RADRERRRRLLLRHRRGPRGVRSALRRRDRTRGRGAPVMSEPWKGCYAPEGALVLSGYWGCVYQVLPHEVDGSVTVKWLGDHERSRPQYANDPHWNRVGNHRTPFDRQRDRVLS